MTDLFKIIHYLKQHKQTSKSITILFVLIATILFCREVEAQYGDGTETTDSTQTSTYVFIPDQSTVVKIGGFAGVHETYPIEGQFQLYVDTDGDTASFRQVDANLIDESGLLFERSLDAIFNFTELTGTIIDDTTIEFAGKTADGTESDILLRLALSDDSIHLTGRTIPPPNSADFFIYELDAVALKKYGGGTGEPNNPYLIYTAEQMNAIGAEPNDWDKYFKLMADVDLSIYKDDEFNIIGNHSTHFDGYFDGNGHKILNFTYSSTEVNNIGLFGFIGGINPRTTIKNLELVDPKIEAGTGNNVGSLVGFFLEGVIVGCSVRGGSISGNNYVGGLVGGTESTLILSFLPRLEILNCFAITSVSGRDNVGGLIGFYEGCNHSAFLENYEISNCRSSGSVSGNLRVGGLVGWSVGCSIIECSSNGEVTGDRWVGGLVGDNRETDILACFSTSNVTGRKNVGGLVGTNRPLLLPVKQATPPPGSIPFPPVSHISSCYCTGHVEGQENVGGLVGENGGSIQFCYSAGPVTNTSSNPDNQRSIGGLVGNNNYGVILLSYWDTEISGQSYSAGGKGKTTEQMMTTNTFRGWGYNDQWVIDEGNDYPRLAWEELEVELIVDTTDRYSYGTGEPNDPYIISNPKDFINIGYYPGDWDKSFLLTDNIDLNDVDSNQIVPIGTYGLPFVGMFDGNDYTISNFKLLSENESYLGVFGSIGPDVFYDVYGTAPQVSDDCGYILNLNLENVEVLAYCCAGGLAGHNQGKISNCSVTGIVNAVSKNAGGLTGFNLGEITDCIAECNVTSEQVAGGLIGHNRGPVTNCSFIGDVKMEGTNYQWCAGGFIGYNNNHIESCHFKGTVTGQNNVGGLIGVNEGGIINCSAKGDVTGINNVGGLVGENDFLKGINGSFSNCIVTGNYRVGGLAGYNAGEILNCYASGGAHGSEDVAGLVGINSRTILFCYTNCIVSGERNLAGLTAESRWAEITSCFWDSDVSGLTDGVADQDPDPEGILGLSTAQMQVSATFINAGWDFENIWTICEGTDYPRLQWEQVQCEQ